MASLCTVSLSVNDTNALKKPTHIVMWQDDNTDTLSNLTERLAALEKMVASLAKKDVPCDVKRTPLISGIGMTRELDCSGSLCAVINDGNAVRLMKEVIERPFSLETSAPLDICPDESSMDTEEAVGDAPEGLEAEEAEEAEGDAPEGLEEEAESDAPEGLEEEEEEEEEEEVAVEYEEIEYKGVTYYKDSENQVYLLDEDGDLDDTPVGIWNPQKEKVLKYATS
jgi:hypothetical protein